LQPLQAADVKHLYVNCYRNDFLSLITKTYAALCQLECWSPVPVVSHIAIFCWIPPTSRELASKVFIGYAPRATAGKNAYLEVLPSLRPVPSAEVPSRAQKR
jgi:hypothetical protein